VYTTLVQTVLSQNQIIDEEQANNLVFLKQFHTNLKESADRFARASAPMIFNEFYEPIDDMDAMLMESVYHTEQIAEGCSVSFRFLPGSDPDLIAESTRLVNEPLAGIAYLREASKDSKKDDKKGEAEPSRAEKKAASMYVKVTDTETNNTSTEKLVTVSDQELRDMALNRPDNHLSEELKILLRMRDDNMTEDQKEKRNDAEGQLQEDIRKLKHDIRENMKLKPGDDGYDKSLAKYRIDSAGRVTRQDTSKASGTKTKTNTQLRRETPVDKAVEAPKLLKDADLKKINGMLPWTIEATFRLRTAQGLDKDVKYVIGIKTVLHLIRTQDLADDLQELVTGNIKSLRKVRYKTGELSFKDYMFNTKGLKADAAKHVNYNKRWINTLKRLADYKDMNGSLMKKPVQALTNGSVPIPNGTLVLAQTDVTTLTNQTGIDLSNVANAKRLSRNLFLIAVAIVDASAGTMRVLFPDSQNDWDVQSLASIDAELSKTENSQLMKELQSAINKR
jgi:uncharacterized protein YbjQ (UPF0145 family)